MTKEKYMALADVQAVWSDKIKPWIQGQKADKSEFNILASAVGVVTDYEFVDLGLPSGTLGAKCNIGATAETGYGGYYQYGKGAKDFFETAGEAMYSGKESPLSLRYDAAAQVMGSPWHLPTKEQMQELLDCTTVEWKSNFNGSGVNGVKLTGDNDNYIFLPASGIPYSDGDIDDRNVVGSYLSSTPIDNTDLGWWCISMTMNSVLRVYTSTGEYAGLNVRGVIDGTIVEQLRNKADKETTYTKTEVDNKLQTKSNINHTHSQYATETELTAATIIPVDLDSMTPTTTFQKNNILALNGVLYRAKTNTTHFPVVLLVEDGQFVVDIVDDAPAYVITDYTLDEDWEIWGDASVKRTLNDLQDSLDAQVEEIEEDQAEFIQEVNTKVNAATKYADLISNTAGTQSYTVQQLLMALADLMDKVVVADNAE